MFSWYFFWSSFGDFCRSLNLTFSLLVFLPAVFMGCLFVIPRRTSSIEIFLWLLLPIHPSGISPVISPKSSPGFLSEFLTGYPQKFFLEGLPEFFFFLRFLLISPYYLLGFLLDYLLVFSWSFFLIEIYVRRSDQIQRELLKKLENCIRCSIRNQKVLFGTLPQLKMLNNPSNIFQSNNLTRRGS